MFLRFCQLPIFSFPICLSANFRLYFFETRGNSNILNSRQPGTVAGTLEKEKRRSHIQEGRVPRRLTLLQIVPAHQSNAVEPVSPYSRASCHRRTNPNTWDPPLPFTAIRLRGTNSTPEDPSHPILPRWGSSAPNHGVRLPLFLNFLTKELTLDESWSYFLSDQVGENSDCFHKSEIFAAKRSCHHSKERLFAIRIEYFRSSSSYEEGIVQQISCSPEIRRAYCSFYSFVYIKAIKKRYKPYTCFIKHMFELPIFSCCQE
ncbi:hypothetical protein RB195_024803 [Necator americanus]|uniref:Uncharacterized protein n=1 Tax=Necator americanus TaxID=51031 RepID=A0ABR1EPN2_NECAM